MVGIRLNGWLCLTCLRRSGAINDSTGEDLIALKIGAYVGDCPAVTLNGRLD